MNARIPNLALLLAQESVCDDVAQYSLWLETAPTKREASYYFGPISTHELAQLTLNHAATDEQLAAACRELRARFLETLDLGEPDADAFRGSLGPATLDVRVDRP